MLNCSHKGLVVDLENLICEIVKAKWTSSNIHDYFTPTRFMEYLQFLGLVFSTQLNVKEPTLNMNPMPLGRPWINLRSLLNVYHQVAFQSEPPQETRNEFSVIYCFLLLDEDAITYHYRPLCASLELLLSMTPPENLRIQVSPSRS